MAANIQSPAPSLSPSELRIMLEERLRAQFPAANQQDIANAIEAALGRRGYMLDDQQDQRNQQNQRDQRNQQQNQRDQRDQRNQQQDARNQRDQQRNQQQDQRNQAQPQREENEQQAAVASVRDAAISAAHAIAEPGLRLAAVASAWVGFAATRALQHEQDQDRNDRNDRNDRSNRN